MVGDRALGRVVCGGLVRIMLTEVERQRLLYALAEWRVQYHAHRKRKGDIQDRLTFLYGTMITNHYLEAQP